MTTAILTAADRHRTVAGRFSQVVERVAPSQWSVPTPVREWVALDVLRHLLDWLPGLLAHGASIHLPSAPDPADEMLRRSGQYGPRVPVSSTAPAQDRLIGFIGRDPNWSPPSLP